MLVGVHDQQARDCFTAAVDERFGFIPRQCVDGGGDLVRDVGRSDAGIVLDSIPLPRGEPTCFDSDEGPRGVLLWNPRAVGV